MKLIYETTFQSPSLCDINVYDENGVWLFSVNNVEMPMPIPSPDQPAQSSRP